MSKLQHVLEEFQAIAEVSSKLQKQKMISDLSDLAKRVAVATLDPYQMYGVKKFDMTLPPVHEANLIDNPEHLFNSLKALANRVVTGRRAVEECEFITQKYCVPAELLSRILNKDLRCGVGATLYNDVFPGVIPEFKVALAKEYEDDDVWPKLASIKYDGLRCLAFIDDTGVTLKTRNGLEITSAENIKPELFRLWQFSGHAPLVLDGELKEKKGHFQDSSSSIRKKKKQAEDLVFMVFDILTVSSFMTRDLTHSQEARIEHLQSFFIPNQSEHLQVVAHNWVNDNSQVQAMYQEALKNGEEGLILKDPQAPYQFKRSSAWVKLKDVKTVDCRVIGIEAGKGKYAGMVGALLVDFEGQPNRVGSGLSDSEREAWIQKPYLIVDKMVELAYHEKTKDGNMRHSRLIKIREDLS